MGSVLLAGIPSAGFAYEPFLGPILAAIAWNKRMPNSDGILVFAARQKVPVERSQVLHQSLGCRTPEVVYQGE
jgi:hypothetical protein